MATDSETAVEMAVVNIMAVEEMNGSGSSFSSVAVAEITISAVKFAVHCMMFKPMQQSTWHGNQVMRHP